MGIVIRIPNANFVDATERVLLPVRSGLIGEYYFGGRMSRSIINHAGGAPLTPTGSLQVNSNEIFLPSGLARLETGITVEPQYPTIVFVGRRNADGLPCSFFSSFQGASNEASSGIVRAGGSGQNLGFRARDENSSANNIALVTNYQSGENAIFSMRVQPASGGGFEIVGRATTADTTETVTESFATNRSSSQAGQPFAIGIDDGIDYASSFYARGASFFNRPLSDSEILEVEAFYKQWLL